jgi:hypothetical protein
MNQEDEKLNILYERLGSHGEVLNRSIHISNGDSVYSYERGYKKYASYLVLVMFFNFSILVIGMCQYVSTPDPRHFTTSYNGDVFEIEESKLVRLSNNEAKVFIAKNKEKFSEEY